VYTPQVSLDSSNKLFLTNFKLTSAPDDTTLRYDLTLRVGGAMQSPSIGLLHCNNMRSGSSYHMVIDALRRFHNEFYAGKHGWFSGLFSTQFCKHTQRAWQYSESNCRLRNSVPISLAVLN
jgi:hypothetical protein